MFFFAEYGRGNMFLSIFAGILIVPWFISFFILSLKSKGILRDPSKRFFMFNNTYAYPQTGEIQINCDNKSIKLYENNILFENIERLDIIVFCYENEEITENIIGRPVYCDVGTKNELVFFLKDKGKFSSYYLLKDENHKKEILEVIKQFKVLGYGVEARHPFDNISQRFIISF